MARARLYKKTTSININIIDIFQKSTDKYRYEKMFDIPITNPYNLLVQEFLREIATLSCTVPMGILSPSKGMLYCYSLPIHTCLVHCGTTLQHYVTYLYPPKQYRWLDRCYRQVDFMLRHVYNMSR